MLGPVLAALAFLADAVVLAATHSWPVPASSAAVYGLLAIAWGLSLAAFFTLRSSGGRGDQPPSLPPDPDPPWWPDFEREFRDYAGRRPRPAGRPRAPVA